MGSKSDWETMRHADEMLTRFGVPHECAILSAHRTPQWTTEFATGAEARGFEVIIAAAGGAAHLPGIVAAHTPLPVLGVPIESQALKGLDSLLSMVKCPAGTAREAAPVPSGAERSCPSRHADMRPILPGATVGVLGSGLV
ncbi:MAG: AIR carboxylase family protein [Acidobacteria bacterium]|nr:AIR carboxylase family protein [Acidobacteriota bacterium]